MKAAKKAQIIIFVDEIDRCRPVYAVELLERIKHLFNIENVIFVISLDKQQLHNSLGAVYGQGINSDEYLRRFIDLEYMLPKPDAKAFTNNLFNRFEFDKFFAKRTRGDFVYEKQYLIDIFTELSDAFELSLRAREQCFTRIRVAMMTTPENYYLYPCQLTTLVLLKTAAPEIYRRYAFGAGTAREVVEYFKERGGLEMLRSHTGTVLEAYLIAEKLDRRGQSDELKNYELMSKDTSINEQEKERADKIVSFIRSKYHNDEIPSLSYVVNKLELATQFK